MKKKLFGTDGVRGEVNTENMNAEILLKFGMAAGFYFSNLINKTNDVVRVVIAKDTRLSGYMIEAALTSGLSSLGVDVTLVGPMPTAAVPMLIHSLRADFGIMITASHNPYYDSGLKIFNSHGEKVDDTTQEEIEEIIFSKLANQEQLRQILVAPEKLGKVRRLDDAIGRYIEYVKGVYSREKRLTGLKIVIDCANGAAYKIAPTILWELGADVTTINCEPNGTNINENCGSMFPEHLSQKVREVGAHIGIALDGDADRLLMCDENGEIINGDHIIGLIAQYMKRSGSLNCSCVVITDLSNGALIEYLKNELNLEVHISPIGDRNVFQTMKKYNCQLGAEQSGHIILSEYSTTGDGILSALEILNVLVENKEKASKIFNLFPLHPQIQRHIRFHSENPLDKIEIKSALKKLQDEKYNDMRILIRKSGTENLIRFMIEGRDDQKITSAMDEFVSIVFQV